MDDKRFKIEPRRYVEPSVVVSMRIPKDMLRDLDRAAEISGRTRNEIISMSLEYALKHMDIEQK
ncbi:MAG: hypothetical protein SOR74_00840 [Candidatus Faecivicinus sp.]|nr:hypothetical protein [Candidatus Faecivicinus sp.]